jgi:phosphatidylglycerol:prolipoprotein diacylglycerol transferase
MLAYPISRFLIEYLRNDEGAFFAGLTISQTISVVLFLGGLIYWAWLLTLPKDCKLEGDRPRQPGESPARFATARV